MRFIFVARRWAIAAGVGITALLAASFPQAAGAQTITGFEEYTVGNNGNIMFRAPNFSGSTSTFLETTPNQTVISTARANTGTKSLNVNFQFKAAQTNPFLRLTTASAPTLPNPAIDLSLALQFALYVPASTPDFYLTLGVRETGTVTTIGGNGGGTGAIEFVGATGLQGSAPLGRLITTKDSWITVVFNLPTEPVRAFAGGNGVLNGTFGTIEGLYITPTSNANVGPYSFFLDDFRQTAAIVTAAPEPASVALFGIGFLGMVGAATRRTAKARA